MSAALLQEQGHEVTGVFLECWREPGCRTDEDRKDALQVALQLKIPFKVLDFRKEYKGRVVDYFYDEYRAGRTPNPDVMCNKEIKFGLFYDWALENGFDYVATGHYARIQRIRRLPIIDYRLPDKFQNKSSKLKIKHQLLRGIDEKKDQSYFLYRLRQEQLGHILFPIGEMMKEEVRKEAGKRKLPVADKPDSQGICFIGPVNIQEFLREKLDEKKGEVVITKCKMLNAKCKMGQHKESCYRVVGEHDGAWFYTIGQRHGFRINSKLHTFDPSTRLRSGKLSAGMKNAKFKIAIPPFYVIEKDMEKNRLVVGFGAETYRDQFSVKDINWIAELKVENGKWNNGIQTRIRHGGELIASGWKVESGIHSAHSSDSVQANSGQEWKIKLSDPQRGVTPGQSAVFYDGDVCLGGGIIA